MDVMDVTDEDVYCDRTRLNQILLNLLGCYVHDLRLQCLEFFNRFYEEGGKPYKPLAIQTKYVDVIKEEH